MLKIIISPAKKMNIEVDVIDWGQLPVFVHVADQIKEILRAKTYDELKLLWACNDKIAAENIDRLTQMDLTAHLTPALLSYEGLQYQYMAPQTFTFDAWEYVDKHLRILSGFYGILGPTDGITPYRLEMGAKFVGGEYRNLYEFWHSRLYEQLVMDATVILNLASKEYSKAVEKYVKNIPFVTVDFTEWVVVKEEKVLKIKATAAKMARGEMVRYLAEHQVKDLEEVKAFDGLGYAYSETHSTANHFVFIKN